MRMKVVQILAGVVMAGGVFLGGVSQVPKTFAAASTAVAPEHSEARATCHTVGRITFWVLTGIDSEFGGTWCHL